MIKNFLWLHNLYVLFNCNFCLLGITLVFKVLLGDVTSAYASEAEQRVALKVTFSITNKGDKVLSPFFQRITYPAANLVQQRLMSKEYLSDEPYRLKKHPNGVDKYIEFKLDIPPYSKIVRHAIFYLSLNHYDYTLDNTTAKTAAESYFMVPTKYVESESAVVKAIAEQIKQTHTGTEDQLRAAFLYPQLHLDYQHIENKGALYALNTGIGDCTEYAAIFVALARAMGIPARLTSEFLFSTRHEFSQPNHHAAEVYLNGHWIPVDPNLALEPALGYGFGLSAISKIVLKRDGSWVWAWYAPEVSQKYLDESVKVNVHWRVRLLNGNDLIN